MSRVGVRIYVEGGGDGSSGKAAIRRGFNAFLSPIRDLVRAKRLQWNLTACGSRESTYDGFCTALKTHRKSFVILLVDSETRPKNPVSAWSHLKQQDNWDRPPEASNESAQLMVQAMEAWIVADPVALTSYYGRNFVQSKLPNIANIENVSPSQLESQLKDATRQTSKSTFHKIQDGESLLKKLSLETVRSTSQSCRRLCEAIEQFVNDS